MIRYTNGDRFRPLDGFKVVAPHWHFAYTVQALEKGFDWAPPFKAVLKDMGVDAAGTLILRETSRQGERIERSILHVRLKPLGPTKLRLPSGAVSIEIDDEQVAVITWLGT